MENPMENPMENQAPQPPQPPREQHATEVYGRQPRPGRRGLLTVLGVILMLTVAALFARGQWLRIREVEITGLYTYSIERVLRQAGITDSATYFNLNEKRIQRNIEDDRYLRFISMEKHWPNGLTLHLLERRKQANVVYMGVQYVVSADGMVLESSNTLNLDNGCLTVSGLSLRDIRGGAPLVCQDSDQLDAMGQVIEELELQGAGEEFSELNLSSLDSIYLVTVDGYTANIGDLTDLRAKVGTVRAVAQELRRRELSGGVIEATIPGRASYRPAQ